MAVGVGDMLEEKEKRGGGARGSAGGATRRRDVADPWLPHTVGEGREGLAGGGRRNTNPRLPSTGLRSGIARVGSASLS